MPVRVGDGQLSPNRGFDAGVSTGAQFSQEDGFDNPATLYNDLPQPPRPLKDDQRLAAAPAAAAGVGAVLLAYCAQKPAICAGAIYVFVEAIQRAGDAIVKASTIPDTTTAEARKADTKEIDAIVKRHGLDRGQREVLHREISGMSLTLEEIEEIAKELSETGEGRIRPGRDQRRRE